MKTTIIITMIVVLSGCTIPRKGSTVGQDYTPSQSGLLGGLIGAGAGAGLGFLVDSSIDQKWQNYGNYTYSGNWNNKPRSGSGGRKGGYSVKSGYNNVSRFTTKNHTGNNVLSGIMMGFAKGQRIGYDIGIENQIRRLQKENEALKQQIN